MAEIATPANNTLSALASSLLRECSFMDEIRTSESLEYSFKAGGDLSFWSENNTKLAVCRDRALQKLEQLTALVRGPHDIIHEFVASNWDHGTLYVFLRNGILEALYTGRGKGVALSQISRLSDIPEDKLSRILGLLKCRQFVTELEKDVFGLTAVSECLIQEPDLRAWVEFQLFETRVASAHLADALAVKPNDYTDGFSGFKKGWGIEMYEWHLEHPEKGDRFRRAMKGVSAGLDPADALLDGWLHARYSQTQIPVKVVELGGCYGFASVSLAKDHASIDFEVRSHSREFLDLGKADLPANCTNISFTQIENLSYGRTTKDDCVVGVYVIRNLLWNWKDEKALRLLQNLLPTLRATPSTRILVTDGVSPSSNEFPPHVETAFRRRDITTMTMHNEKQRNQDEWLRLFSRVAPNVIIKTSFKKSSHVLKGLWEISLELY